MDDPSSNGQLIDRVVTIEPRTSATLDAILAQDTDQEQRVRHWQLVAAGCLVLAIASMGLAYVGWFTRPDVIPFVQLVQVDDRGKALMVGEPMRPEAYTVQEAQWRDMLAQWVIRLRWRGIDKPQAQAAWTWLDMYSCGLAREQLAESLVTEKPMEMLGVKKRQIALKNILKSDMPHAFTIIWDEMEVTGPYQPVTRTVSGTFTVGRRKVNTTELALHNPLGLCTTGYHWNEVSKGGK